MFKLALLFVTLAATLGWGALFGAQQARPSGIVIAEQIVPGGSPSLAGALCVLLEESPWRSIQCSDETLQVDPSGDWSARIKPDGIDVAIVDQKAVYQAWNGIQQKRTSPSLRWVFKVSDDKVIVSSTLIADWNLAHLAALLMDRQSRLIELYPDASRFLVSQAADGQDRAWVDQPPQAPPLHPGAWQILAQRGWKPEPFWLVVGSYKDGSEAFRFAHLLRNSRAYGSHVPRGFQVRRSANGYYAVIYGGITDNQLGDRERRRLATAIPVLGSPYLFPAIRGTFPKLRGWGANLLDE